MAGSKPSMAWRFCSVTPQRLEIGFQLRWNRRESDLVKRFVIFKMSSHFSIKGFPSQIFFHLCQIHLHVGQKINGLFQLDFRALVQLNRQKDMAPKFYLLKQLLKPIIMSFRKTPEPIDIIEAPIQLNQYRLFYPPLN